MSPTEKSDIAIRTIVSILFAAILGGATWLLLAVENYRGALVYGAATVLCEVICWWPAREPEKEARK